MNPDWDGVMKQQARTPKDREAKSVPAILVAPESARDDIRNALAILVGNHPHGLTAEDALAVRARLFSALRKLEAK